jgi:hypothetical protein
MHLDVYRFPAHGDAVLHPDIGAISDINFEKTVNLASRYVRWVIGWPSEESFQIALTPIAPESYPLPDSFRGESLFGALTMALTQAVARTHRDCVRSGTQRFLHIFESVRLDFVAVCAAFNNEDHGGDENEDHVGDFKPVGCIGNKLESFCLPEVPRPAVSVVARNQDLTKRCGPNHGYALQVDQNSYHPHNNSEPLPILRARDPIEAFLRLWDEQAGALVKRL